MHQGGCSLGQISTGDVWNSTELPQLVEEFIAFQINMGIYVHNSGQAVRSDFRGFFRYLNDHGVRLNVDAFNPRFIADYLAFRRKQVEGSTIKRWVKSFNAFAKWAVQRNYLEQNPVADIRIGWVPTRRREFMLDVEGARRFLTVPVRTRLIPQVDQVLRNLLIFGGLRRNEILKRQWKDVDFSRNLMLIHDTKNSRRKGHPDNLDRVIPLTVPLQKALNDLYEAVRPSPGDPIVFLRPGRRLSKDAFYTYFQSLREALGLGEEFVPHSMRHSLASNLIALGATVADVALLLGHSTLQQDGRRSVTDGYVTSSLSRIQAFLNRYAAVLSDSLAGSVPIVGFSASTLPDATAEDGAGRRRNLWSGSSVPYVTWDSPPFDAGRADHHSSVSYRCSPDGMEGQLFIPDPGTLAEAVALWKSFYPTRRLDGPEFHQFLRRVSEQMNKRTSQFR